MIATQKKPPIIYSRQIAFAAAFILPVSKLLEAPSLLAKYAAGDLLLPALSHFLLQSALLALLLFVITRSDTPLIERLQNRLGKFFPVLCAVYALFFLFFQILPILDLEKFVYAAFFDTAPTFFSFIFFFFFSAFVCTKGIKTVGRFADICLFLFVFPFAALLIMSLSESDFSHLLPLFGTKFGDTMSAFTHTTSHFSDCILLLPLLLFYHPKKSGDCKKVLFGYWTGAALSLFFFAIFFGVYSSIAPREHYAFSKIAQYFPALDIIGRIDLIFIYLLFITLLFYTCLPLLYTTSCAATLFHTEKKTLFSFLLNVGVFFFIFFCNKYYDSFYTLISGKLYWVFWIFADILPIFLLFLTAETKPLTLNATDKKEASHA